MALRSRKTQSKSGHRLRNWTIVGVLVCLLLLVMASYRTYEIYQSELPSFEQLHNIEPSVKTKVFDRNGILLKEFYSENRVLTPLKDVPQHLVDMLISTEDRAYYDHWGIHFRRLVMVAAQNVLHMRITGGASTISQQLARMLFLNQQRTMERKIKEALTTIKLERTYSKDEIIEMYLNQYYFSRGAYGIAAASHMFFDKRPEELDLNESAILLGLLPAPNINSPFNDPDKARRARNRVLYAFYTNDGITREVYDSLVALPLSINPPEEQTGTAPYFTETIRRYVLDKYGESKLYSSGLKIYSSLDARLQRAAEAAVHKKIDSTQARIERTFRSSDPNYTMFLPDTVDAYGDSIRVYKKIQGAFAAIDNSNGDVLAMVGGRSFEESEYNRAVQAPLQPGSAFKPFVYTACIDNGFKTTDIIDDNPIVLDIPGAAQWRPHNYDGKFKGPITLRDGIRMSRNLVAIRLLLKISPQEAIFYAKRMGITSELDPVPSLAIGTEEVRLIELVSAFSTFPNKGIHIPYRLIHRIEDRYGRVLEDNTSIPKEEVLSRQTAYIMVDLMRSVVDNGTGARARWMGFSRPAGGKTGTSNSFCDNWFVGYTPQITAGAWIGFDDKTSLGRNQDGAKNGVPVWTEFMMAAHDSLPIMDFEEPDGIVHADVCLESGELATDRCMNVRNEVFVTGTEPTTTCHLHPSKGLYVAPTGKPEDQLPTDSTDDRVHF